MSPGGGGAWVGENNRAVTTHLFPQCRGFSRALILRNSLFPPFPVGGGGAGAWIQMTGA